MLLAWNIAVPKDEDDELEISAPIVKPVSKQKRRALDSGRNEWDCKGVRPFCRECDTITGEMVWCRQFGYWRCISCSTQNRDTILRWTIRHQPLYSEDNRIFRGHLRPPQCNEKEHFRDKDGSSNRLQWGWRSHPLLMFTCPQSSVCLHAYSLRGCLRPPTE